LAREGLEGEAYARSVHDDARGELDGGVGGFLVNLHDASLRRRDAGKLLGLLDTGGDELLPLAFEFEQGDFRGGRGDVGQRGGPHEIDVQVGLLLGIVELLLGHPNVTVPVDVDPCHLLREVDRAFDEVANRHLYVKRVWS